MNHELLMLKAVKHAINLADIVFWDMVQYAPLSSLLISFIAVIGAICWIF